MTRNVLNLYSTSTSLLEEEPVDHWNTDMRTTPRTWEVGGKNDNMIRDKICLVCEEEAMTTS